MKKYLLLFFTFFLVTTPVVNTVWAFDEDRECTDQDGNCEEDVDMNCPEEGFSPSNCATTTNVSMRGCGTIKSCTKCNTGYVLVSDYYIFSYDGNEKEIAGCEKGCDTSTCKSDTTWTAGNTGYQKKTNRSCSGTSCVASTVYRCAVGYYGSSSNGTSGCARCPTISSLTGTSPAGTTAATGCYIASGTTGRDTTGNFTYAGNSYYCQ